MTLDPADRPLEVLIVEDHLSVRKGLELMLQSAGMRIVGVAASAESATALLRDRSYDVALIDLYLDGGHGLAVIEDLLSRKPGAAVVIHTGATNAAVLTRAAEVGARGLVLKSSAPKILIHALEQVARGGTVVDPALAGQLAGMRSANPVNRLSPREREVLGLLATGLTGEQIADQLYLSRDTVRTHVRNAMTKLEVKTRVHAVALVVQDRSTLP